MFLLRYKYLPFAVCKKRWSKSTPYPKALNPHSIPIRKSKERKEKKGEKKQGGKEKGKKRGKKNDR